MMQNIRNSRLGNLVLGDTPVSPAQAAARAGQGSAGASGSIGDRPALRPVEHTLSMSGPPVYEGCQWH